MRCYDDAVRIAWLVLTVGIAAGQTPRPSVNLFPPRTQAARKETGLLSSKEVTIQGRIWQVFSNKKSKTEVFRVNIGLIENGEPITFWNYGIVLERDLNGDGLTDFSWYGGDDAGSEYRVAFSGPQGYRIIDPAQTVERAWARRFRTQQPDLRATGGDRLELLLEPGPKPVLIARVIPIAPEDKPVSFRIEAVDFAAAKQ
jgi:hypothetical protein